ncbi:uncharacterized protein [Dysidea avara]|uniref:uncharacterized protein n=1 Tax=Dysidea avara TaxID=196820 RepID=UPI0033170218
MKAPAMMLWSVRGVRWFNIGPATFSITLDPYYRNQNAVFTSEEYHTGLIIMRIPTNLFGLPKKHKNSFSSKIQTYAGHEEPDVPNVRFSLVVVGPIDSDRKVSMVNQIIEIHSRSKKYFVNGSIMIIF